MWCSHITFMWWSQGMGRVVDGDLQCSIAVGDDGYSYDAEVMEEDPLRKGLILD